MILRALLVLSGLTLLGQNALAAERWVEEPAPPGIHVEVTDQDGPVFADAKGMTLYIWPAKDQPGKSFCNDDHYADIEGFSNIRSILPEADHRLTCQQVWPPALAAADATPLGKWSVIARHDGTRQWAYNGQPLYTSTTDHQPGEVNGVGVGFIEASRSRTPLKAKLDNPADVLVQVFPEYGRVLTTVDGFTLYASDKNTSGAACKGCDGVWAPFPAPDFAQPRGDWSVVKLKDGASQWAYLGKPLFYAIGEKKRKLFPPDVPGWRPVTIQDMPGWQPVVVQPAPKPPAAITIQASPAGELLADFRGHTLYTFSCVEEAKDQLNCDNPAASQTYRFAIYGSAEKYFKEWPMLLADANAKPENHTWSIATIDRNTGHYAQPGAPNADRVWMYRGRPVYTNAEDGKPGDTIGQMNQGYQIWDFDYLRVVRDFSDPDAILTN